MGMKKRDFTGMTRTAIMDAVAAKGPLTRREILEELRGQKALRPSVRRVGVALGRLLKAGTLIQVGARANARFRPAKA